MNEKLMNQILEGIRDLQKGQLELKKEVRNNSDRMDQLERRQIQFEKNTNRQFYHLITHVGSVEEHLVKVAAEVNTLKGLTGNIIDRLDTLDNHVDVIDQAYLGLRDRVKNLEDQ